MTTVGRLGSGLARHSLALIVTVVAACIVWTLTYFALLAGAVVSDGGVGGPLAYPAGLLFALVATSMASLALLLPSTVGGEWVARRRGWPVLVQIPLSVACLGGLCFAVVALVSAIGSRLTLNDVSAGFGVLFLALLVPLGVYWWAAQSGPLLLSIVRRRAHRGEA